MEVIWTRQALEEVNRIVNYIARDDFQAARRWADEIQKKTDKLADHPRLGRVVPEFEEETLREIIAGNYRIAYRIKESTIFIATVWHVRQLPDDVNPEK